MSSLPLHLESLETRRLLAGLVTVDTNAAGDVIINGDNEANEIRLVLDRSGVQSYLVVEGENGTEIEFDGITNDQRIVPISTVDASDFAIDRDLRIRMRGGDDDVEILAWLPIGRLKIARDLNVDMGSGDDRFYIAGDPTHRSEVQRNLTVNAVAGVGHDYLEVNQMLAERVDLRLGAAGEGIDQAVFRGSFTERLRMNGTSGETELAVADSLVVDARLTSGTGADQVIIGESQFGTLYVNAGSAPNEAVIGDYMLFGSGQVHGNATFVGTGGNTTLNIDATAIGSATGFMDRVTINLGAGDDAVFVTNSELTIFLGDVTINAGGGDDVVEIQGKTFFAADLTVDLGGGDDELDFDYDPVADVVFGTPFPPTVFGQVTVRGGGGYDVVRSAIVVDLNEPINDVSIEAFLI